MDLTKKQLERYARNIKIESIGVEGQKKIRDFSVLIIGVGGLGSPAILYLTAAGIGNLGILDSDYVELSNLQRQVIHFTSDIGKPKVNSALAKIKDLNPDVEVTVYNDRLTEKNIAALISKYDFIIDCSDNFPTKFLINDACVLIKKPFSHSGVFQYIGQLFTYIPDTGNCLRCIFEKIPAQDYSSLVTQSGILGVTAGIFGTIQAAEALKYALGDGKLISNSLLSIDVRTMEFSKIAIRKNSKCPACSPTPAITSLEEERYSI